MAHSTSLQLVYLDPASIDVIEPDPMDETLGPLRESLRTFGQVAPVMVRPDPRHPGRFCAVYGHARIASLAAEGKHVLAVVRDLGDVAAVEAEVCETFSARPRTFIERASAAAGLADLGVPRARICLMLFVDKTQLSKMISVHTALGWGLISAIGTAPGIGRPQWRRLARLVAAGDHPLAELEALAVHLADLPSAQRFNRVLDEVTAVAEPPEGNPPIEFEITNAAGREVMWGTRFDDALEISVSLVDNPLFGGWLAQNLRRVYDIWVAETGEMEDELPSGNFTDAGHQYPTKKHL